MSSGNTAAMKLNRCDGEFFTASVKISKLYQSFQFEPNNDENSVCAMWLKWNFMKITEEFWKKKISERFLRNCHDKLSEKF